MKTRSLQTRGRAFCASIVFLTGTGQEVFILQADVPAENQRMKRRKAEQQQQDNRAERQKARKRLGSRLINST